MTVAPVIPVTALALTGSDLGPFQTSFPFEQSSDVEVAIYTPDATGALYTAQDLALNYDYTMLAPAPLDNGGQVTLNAALPPSGGWPSGALIRMVRHTVTGQATALGDQVGFQPSSYEAALDHLARQVQDADGEATAPPPATTGGGPGTCSPEAFGAMGAPIDDTEAWTAAPGVGTDDHRLSWPHLHGQQSD